MKSALLFTSAAFAVISVARCVSQQTVVQSSQQEAEAVVIKLYKQVVFRKPDGIPWGKDRNAIWPMLSNELIDRLRVASECEKDYFRQYPKPDPKDPNALILKPPFAWMETGLFSGGNEQANPFWFGLRRTVRQKDGSYEVHVKLKRWDEFHKYPRPRGPEYDWTWEVVVFVIRDSSRYAVNDVFYPEVHSDHAVPRYPTVEEIRLSQLLSVGCNDGKWIGYPDN